MKMFIALILCVSIFVVACHKDNVIAGAGSTTLFGRWELRSVSSNFPSVSYPPGNGNVVQYNKDSTFAFYKQATITGQGTFHIKAGTSLNGFTPSDSIFYKPAVSAAEVIQLKNDTLIIGTSIADGLTSVYVRQ